MPLALVFVSGLLFAVGLGISGMTQPEKVSSFLNVMNDWDPSLALVMLGASGTYFVGQKIIAFQRTKQLLPSKTTSSSENRIDKSLVGGSALFGLGWGMVGFCPGPAIVALSTGSFPVLVFVVSMIVGITAYNMLAMYAMGVSPKDETALESESIGQLY